mmetsp:Transcript_21881/g.18796  ORF Transcript_21881/g.18796 Transcript_21881/m.18796 type:complete len:214 (-) Transcript_21881:56-697(-)
MTYQREAIIYFFVQGIATLIGWNCVLNAFDVFQEEMPHYQVTFLYPCAMYFAYGAGNILIVPISRVLSINQRVIIHLAIQLVAFMIMPFVVVGFSDSTIKFWVSIVLLAIMGYSNQMFQSSVSGIASQMKGFYIGYFLSGSGLSGIIMNVSKMITLLTFPKEWSNTIGMFAYFSVGGVIFIACIVLHLKFQHNPLYKMRIEEPQTHHHEHHEK